MDFAERQKLRGTTFREQIQIVLRVERQLRGRWVIQRFQFERWLGVRINPLMADNPVHEEYPITGIATYETSGEAVEAMVRLHQKYPALRMRVRPVEKDIAATYLWPRTYNAQQRFGQYPTWGQLRRQFSDVLYQLHEPEG